MCIRDRDKDSPAGIYGYHRLPDCIPADTSAAFAGHAPVSYTHLDVYQRQILGPGGKEDGWDFIQKLYDNLDGKIVDSSGKCHKMVADGEFYVGLTLEKAAVQRCV